VAFGKNGSDCLTAGARLARAVTGREVIVQYGMHGFHDWYVVHNPVIRGAPQALRPLIQSFEYNDLEGLGELLQRFDGKVAAVIMEPVREILPESGYLESVRELTHRHGALLIFDEVVTSFRLGHGGAQSVFGVEPDVACLGKAMANGMPLSAIVGRREVMEQLPAVAFGMTFRGETLTLAAARAVLKILREEPVAEHVARIGTAVRDGFDEACRRHDLSIGLGGPPGRMTFIFREDGGLSWDSAQALFVQECLKRGVFTNGNILPSYAHDDEAVERTIEGFDGALEVVAEAVHAGRAQIDSGSNAPCSGPRAMISTGYIEELRLQGSELAVAGWAILKEEAADRVEFVAPDGKTVVAQGVDRPDLAEAYPLVRDAETAGYVGLLPAEFVAGEESFEFTIRLYRLERLTFICRVVIETPPDSGGAWPGPHWTGDGIKFV
jgi:acetylornithine/succinyldiaminopimelate/putrescine aminotransferase